jgi:sodium-dependent dicarboxylate transporter 2/3/5
MNGPGILGAVRALEQGLAHATATPSIARVTNLASAPRGAAPKGDERIARTDHAKRAGLILGIVACLAMLAVTPPAGLKVAAWRTAAVATLMAIWWMTEAIPIGATALVPLVLFPLLGIAPITAAAAPFANPVIFLFLGGFLLAAAFQRCGLHRRVALAIVAAVGTRPDRLVLGFLTATAAISCWVSNTATVVMLLPLAAPVIALVCGEGEQRTETSFEPALLLALAYGASLGGIGTLIGTPPNALFAGFMAETHGLRVSFVRWMMLGVPIVAISLPITWFILTRLTLHVGRTPNEATAGAVRAQRQALGPISRGEKLVGTIVFLAAMGWIFQPLLARVVPGISDAGVAITAALLLFLLPLGDGRPALDWAAAEATPWGVLILFGGGLSLADAVQNTGFAAWLGTSLEGLRAVPPIVVIFVVTTLIVFISELASNTATAAAFLPLVSSLAVAIGADPLQLATAAALAASCSFVLPVGTPPNAIVFGAGRLILRG